MPPVILTLRAIDDEVEPVMYPHYDFAQLLPSAAHRDPEGRRRLRGVSRLEANFARTPKCLAVRLR